MSRYVSHHPTLGDISSPTDICFGDLQNLQKGTSIPPPEWTQEGYPHFRKPRM